MHEASWLEGMPWVRERFIQRGGVKVDLCAIELGRFFQLTRCTDRPLALVSRNIDLLWHTFIEFTESYSSFCLKHFGEIIHHRARTSHSPVPAEAIANFLRGYTERFGPLPAAWTADADPQILAFGFGHADVLSEDVAWSGWPGRDVVPLEVIVAAEAKSATVKMAPWTIESHATILANNAVSTS